MDYKSILIKVRRIVRSINLESKKVQKDFGVSIPQILCLEFLKSSPNYQTSQLAIREHMNLNSSTVTGIIGRLEKNGLLARLPKSGDKRITHISLTSAGDKLLEKTPDLLQQRLASKLKRMTSEELAHMSDILGQLIEMLEIEESEEFPVISADGLYDVDGASPIE
jgi:DNA-binding MarR family transcriptional regulator